MNPVVKKFTDNVSAILEPDYGDFMRVANTYLLQMKEGLQVFHDRKINQRISEMQIYLQFNPSWNVEPTREKLLRDAQFLDDLVKGQPQRWESAA